MHDYNADYRRKHARPDHSFTTLPKPAPPKPAPPKPAPKPGLLARLWAFLTGKYGQP